MVGPCLGGALTRPGGSSGGRGELCPCRSASSVLKYQGEFMTGCCCG